MRYFIITCVFTSSLSLRAWYLYFRYHIKRISKIPIELQTAVHIWRDSWHILFKWTNSWTSYLWYVFFNESKWSWNFNFCYLLRSLFMNMSHIITAFQDVLIDLFYFCRKDYATHQSLTLNTISSHAVLHPTLYFNLLSVNLLICCTM